MSVCYTAVNYVSYVDASKYQLGKNILHYQHMVIVSQRRQSNQEKYIDLKALQFHQHVGCLVCRHNYPEFTKLTHVLSTS